MLNEQGNLIDRQTIAVASFSKENQRSIITKIEGTFFSTKTPLELINEACLKYASTLEGRKQAVMQIFNYYKPPVIISPFNLSFFPTASYNNYDCAFIFNHPFRIFEEEKGVSRLFFYDAIDISVSASAHTLQQQHHRLHTVINYFRDFRGVRGVPAYLEAVDKVNITDHYPSSFSVYDHFPGPFS